MHLYLMFRCKDKSQKPGSKEQGRLHQMVGRLLKDEKEILQEFKILKTDRELTQRYLRKL